MEGGKNHERPRFCIEVNLPKGGCKIPFLRLHHGTTIQSAVDAAVDIHYKTVCFNLLFDDVNIFSVVLSKKDNLFYYCPPLPPLRSLH